MPTIDPSALGADSCSLRRTRSLAVIREETYNDLQISGVRTRRSQLIPRAKLCNRSFFKNRWEFFKWLNSRNYIRVGVKPIKITTLIRKAIERTYTILHDTLYYALNWCATMCEQPGWGQHKRFDHDAFPSLVAMTQLQLKLNCRKLKVFVGQVNILHKT